MTSSDTLDRLARRRAKAKLGWFAHAAVYVAVNLVLIAVSVSTGRGWALYPVLGWGLGLMLHGVSVWLFAPGGQWLERMVQRERSKLAPKRADPW